MHQFLRMPALQAVGILSVLHGVLCLAIAGTAGLKETAIFSTSAVGTVLLSRAVSLSALFTWFRSNKSQFLIRAASTACMGLFLTYRSLPRLDIAALELASTATFFMFMVSVGNRLLK